MLISTYAGEKISVELAIVVGALGCGAGVISGMLGAGGASILVPLLLYIPPLLGLEALNVRDVAAIAITQVLFASSSGVLTHQRTGNIDGRIAIVGGGLGGGFMTVPILYRLLNVPLRLAIGNSMAVAWFGATTGLIGKLATNQVPLPAGYSRGHWGCAGRSDRRTTEQAHPRPYPALHAGGAVGYRGAAHMAGCPDQSRPALALSLQTLPSLSPWASRTLNREKTSAHFLR